MKDRVKLDEAVNKLEACLTANGYKVRRSHPRCDDVIKEFPTVQVRFLTIHAVSVERGVKIRFQADALVEPVDAYIDVDIQVRDYRGRMVKSRTIYRSLRSQQDVEDALPKIAALRGSEVTKPLLRRKEDLYEPLRFTKPFLGDGTPNRKGQKRSILDHVFASCHVDSIVTIQDDLSIVQGAETPDRECWFLINGASASKDSSAHPDIIVSERGGELVYYPLRGKRITDEFQPKNTHIDFLAFTELDRMLIDHAIQRFLEKV